MADIIPTTIHYKDIEIEYELHQYVDGVFKTGSFNGKIAFEFAGTGDFTKYIKDDKTVNVELFATDFLRGEIKLLN